MGLKTRESQLSLHLDHFSQLPDHPRGERLPLHRRLRRARERVRKSHGGGPRLVCPRQTKGIQRGRHLGHRSALRLKPTRTAILDTDTRYRVCLTARCSPDQSLARNSRTIVHDRWAQAPRRRALVLRREVMGKVFLEANAMLALLALHLHEERARAALPHKEGPCAADPVPCPEAAAAPPTSPQNRHNLSALPPDLCCEAAKDAA